MGKSLFTHSGARCLIFGMSILMHISLVYVSSEGTGETDKTVHLSRLLSAFAVCLCDM